MARAFFYVPFLYNYHTRLRSYGKLVSWILIYVIPVLYFAVYLQSDHTLNDAIVALLYIVLIYVFYELGYIENDTETIKREHTPTMRLNTDELEYYEKHKRMIYASRVSLGTFLAGMIYVLSNNKKDIWIALLIAFLLLLIFHIYNRIRNIANLYFQIVMVTLRYSSCQFLFFDDFNWVIFLLSIFAFPLPNFIERAADVHVSKFHQNWARNLVTKIGLFRYRMYFYLIITILLFPLYIFSIIQFKVWLIFMYYFAYRMLLLLKFGK